MAIIDKPSDYFNTKLYTGTGSTLNITGVGFQPDLVWTKGRDSTAEGVMDHALVDSVRGVTKTLRSNTTAAEGTEANSLTAFGSDGYTVGNNGKFNYSSSDIYVSWNWLAGGTASSNTEGTITASSSVNTDAGFGIATWTGNGTAGANIGHGLNQAPEMFFVKQRTGVQDFTCWNKTFTSSEFCDLSSDIAKTSFDVWNTVPDSTKIYFANQARCNASGSDYVGYYWHSVNGYSKIGSYTGNGSTDGTFVYTGFKPAFVMIKRTDSAGSWYMYDNKINPENVMDTILFANRSDAESTNSNENLDFLSNGFKLRTTSAARNASGGSYIYMAFAENPLVGTNNIPATAR